MFPSNHRMISKPNRARKYQFFLFKLLKEVTNDVSVERKAGNKDKIYIFLYFPPEWWGMSSISQAFFLGKITKQIPHSD